jgi:hypothetical protein
LKLYFTVHDTPKWTNSATENIRHLAVQDFITAGHEVVDAPDADIVINLNNHYTSGTNVIMLSWEPPYYPHYTNCFRDTWAYHTVYRFGDCDPEKNSFLITEDPIAFPYHAYSGGLDVPRADTTLRNRRVFFAGVACYGENADADGRRGLYAARTRLVHDLQDNGVGVYAEGKGYGRDSRDYGRVADWEQIKLKLCRTLDVDFHLCAENCQLNGYISEKIHHGFQSDLVVLYLGNTDIEKYVPREAFVNLNEYFEPRSHRVNAAAVADLLKTMTQKEYDDIIHAAREWRRSARLANRFEEQCRVLSRKIIERIEREGAR